MKFIAIDVETANPDYSTICQVGIASFEDGIIKETWSSLVNPEDYFDPINVSIHGISESEVKDSPIFTEVFFVIKQYTSNNIVVHHMPFDKVAISRAVAKYNLDNLSAKWLDSARVTRRAWQRFIYKGYNLSNVAMELGIKFKHHDALEDAIAAGKIVTQAIVDTGISLEDWLDRAYKPIPLAPGQKGKTFKLEGNPNGPLYGENLVFTGTLSIPRRKAAEIAANAGCNVSNSVNKMTTILVVGNQELKRLKGKDKSSKQLKTEKLIKKEIDIKIISEEDLFLMVD
ncbi:MAG: transposase [bacterium (Candidatus Ratteibacteria) CG01_land_8_20_14_3_00_40_19]|uniref:Transposase n=1 Tax=bacterium (Candidatus Ratteibacteria) CG01_land_8_20_14_3_00_40_19 TaxID=2014290 RepID=A0A2M7E876_9BACT|nr:MAG: transposase [bacterium (Candidatus Ratteibacteria) CG01_land_8_20_14_3_00_40_19]